MGELHDISFGSDFWMYPQKHRQKKKSKIDKCYCIKFKSLHSEGDNNKETAD